MNYKALVFLFMAMVAVVATSCDDEGDSVPVTGIILDQTSLDIKVDSSAVLVATLQPEGVTGTIEWSSSDPSIVAVNNGVIIALKTGEATIVAMYEDFSATCNVTVSSKPTGPGSPSEALQGSDYYLIQLDAISRESIADKILEDMSPDNIEGSKNLYIWENTFIGGEGTGVNYFGQAEGWISLVVNDIGWSGAGYTVGASYDGELDLTNMFKNPDDYYFHIAFKSAQASSSYLFIFNDGNAEAKVCIGSTAFEDGGETFQPYADFARDNEWHAIEIPVSYLNTLGVFYNKPFKDVNVLAWLAGGTQGTTLDFDAAFFYKKASK